MLILPGSFLSVRGSFNFCFHKALAEIDYQNARMQNVGKFGGVRASEAGAFVSLPDAKQYYQLL